MSTDARSRKPKSATAGATAARAVVRMLAVTGKRFTLEELRERLPEFYREEPGKAVRAAAALSAKDPLSALVDLNTALAGVGFQVRVVSGLVSLGTTRRKSEKLSGNLVFDSDLRKKFWQSGILRPSSDNAG